MFRLFYKMKHKKKKGNLLMIVLLSAVVISMMSGIVVKAVNDATTAKKQNESVTDIYTYLAFSNMFANAFVQDLGNQFFQQVVDVGMLEITPELFVAMIGSTHGVVDTMNMTAQADGSYLYVGNAAAVANDVTFDPGTNVLMQTQFNRHAAKIDTFKIQMARGLQTDDSHAGNVLEGKNGDRIYLKNIVFGLTVAIGARTFYQEYLLKDVYAEFFVGESVITCNIKTDEASLYLTNQQILRQGVDAIN